MKLKYILPVATIASVATAVTPLAVSCGTKTIELNKFFTGIGSAVGCKSSKPINIKANTQYHVTNKKESWTVIQPEWLEECSFCLLAFEDEVLGDPQTLMPKEVSITVNKTKLTKTENLDSLQKNQFFAGQIEKEMCGVIIGEGTLIDFEKMEATISFVSDLDDANIYFMVAG